MAGTVVSFVIEGMWAPWVVQIIATPCVQKFGFRWQGRERPGRPFLEPRVVTAVAVQCVPAVLEWQHMPACGDVSYAALPTTGHSSGLQQHGVQCVWYVLQQLAVSWLEDLFYAVTHVWRSRNMCVVTCDVCATLMHVLQQLVVDHILAWASRWLTWSWFVHSSFRYRDADLSDVWS